MIRSLDGVGWDVLATAFEAAFADYAVPMKMTAAGLAAMQRRRGYVASLSFGAWDGARLVGFVLTCEDGGRVYNSGTGLEPAARGKGLAKQLVEAVIAATGGRDYVLEVIAENAPAIALYERAGFTVSRELQCWQWEGTAARIEATTLAPASFAPDFDIAPSWQNSLAAIERADGRVVLGDERGIIVVVPATGDVPLLCVRRASRRHGFGRALLGAAGERAHRPLRLLNVEGAGEILTALGATRTVRQLEMIRTGR